MTPRFRRYLLVVPLVVLLALGLFWWPSGHDIDQDVIRSSHPSKAGVMKERQPQGSCDPSFSIFTCGISSAVNL